MSVAMLSVCYGLPHGQHAGSLSGYLSSATLLRSGLQPAQRFLRARKASVGVKGALGSARVAGPLAKTQLCQMLHLEQHRPGELEDRIRDELTAAAPPLASGYDTAWVAMVPAAPGSPHAPRFPQCVEWILQNQLSDGSWGLGRISPSPGKDALSSTLACVLALRTWGVGDEHVRNGLRFIGCNSSCATDDNCDTPAGFNIIFPGMMGLGVAMGLELPLKQADADAMLRLRDMELRRYAGSKALGTKAFMAYVAEGLGKLQDWDQVMPYQRQNGSLFNSPSTTAAAAIHNYNDRALAYLDSLVSKFGSSVPTTYPLNVYSQLHMVDTLEKMGISRSFACEINSILDIVHRSWLDNDEEIMLDMATCAMTFRLLRMHGYDVSSDGLSQFKEESSFRDSIQGHLNDTTTLLELYKASQVQILKEDLILESIGTWSVELLKQQLRSNKISRSVDPAEVEHALKFPFYVTLERLEHRWNIEHLNTDGFQILKSAYHACRVNEEIVALAAHEFCSSQLVYQGELRYLESWVKEGMLDELKFARMMPLNCVFSAVATMFPPELSKARIVWSENCVLTTVVDDFFDVAASREEAENLVTLIEKWDTYDEIGFCSEQVETVFRAVYHTSKRQGYEAAAVQNRSVDHHISELWLSTARTMMAEAEWRWNGHVPSIEEYLRVSEVSFALGPMILPSVYLVGPELSEDVIRCPEYGKLYTHASICGRLLNDLRTYERESSQGKLNIIVLRALPHGGGSTAVEAAKEDTRKDFDAHRRELLRLLVREGGAVPRPCKELFWGICKVFQLFYLEKDGYVLAEDMMGAANSVIWEPLRVRD